MADKFSPAQRSVLMSGIKSKGTRFELDFLVLLRKQTRRKIETHAKDVRGTPDIIFRKEKVCVFLDSDFWHGWRYPLWKRKLKDNFWREKIERNRRRDRKVIRYLRSQGWNVVRIWEHQIKRNPERAVESVLKSVRTS